jgi:DNA polymerase elongation subunit (family B)
MKPTVVFDIEVYQNYFLVAFMNAVTGKVRHLEMTDHQSLDVETLRAILRSYRLVSFNGINFDLPLVSLALKGASCSVIKRVADQMIKHGLRYWSLGIEPVKVDHIDLMEVAPGRAGLKLYGARMHCESVQHLPIEPDALISPEQHTLLRHYCENDLRLTLALYQRLTPQLSLREQLTAQYGLDLRSKSDAQIAEAVIKAEVERGLGHPLPKKNPTRLVGVEFRYRPPAFIQFTSDCLRELLARVCDTAFTVGGNGAVQLPKVLRDLEVSIGRSIYRLGIGGLHSSEKSVAYHSDEHAVLIDRDVTSYYPSIILNCGLRPDTMGDHFSRVYRELKQRRLAAKRMGDQVQADSLKITINGSFGKFGSPYSCLYSPTLLIQTTITGQLALLMLIEALEDEGIAVVSANTDGLVMHCPRTHLDLAEYIVWEWEFNTGFETEATEYKALYSRDVNNYLAITAEGCKVKGVLKPANLIKNPQADIVTRAVIARLRHGTPVDDTIRSSRDITQFLAVRTVRGGAIKDGEDLGAAVRWYYSKESPGAIHYKVNNYIVPKTEGARPIQKLPAEFPADIDLDWYIQEAQDLLQEIGAQK